MKQLGDFLERFTHIAKKSDETKEYILSLFLSIGIQGISKKDIQIKGTVLFIKTSPVKKSEIRLKEKTLLSLLKESSVTKNIQKIV